jgi:hypothetical protein
MNKRIRFSMDKKSLRTFGQNLNKVSRIALTAAYYTLDDLADLVLSESKDKTPVDTRALKSSAFMESEMFPNKVVAHVGYGGKYNKLNPKTFKWTDSYAVDVHEIQSVGNVASKPGTTWKFLEKAINEVNPIFVSLLGEGITAALNKSNEMKIQKSIGSFYRS